MNHKTCLGLALAASLAAALPALPRAAHAAKSEVRLVKGRPRLFIDGQETGAGLLVNVYHLPPPKEGMGNAPVYRSRTWLARMISTIDRAQERGAQIVIFSLWWRDVDTSERRSAHMAANYDFANLDAVMDYLAAKRMYAMPSLVLSTFLPEWWMKENHIPPLNPVQPPPPGAGSPRPGAGAAAARSAACDLCETDSYGNVYDNVSMNNAKAHRDYGDFLKAVINRYKGHPALAGWITGVGATGEDNYGPNYVVLELNHIERKPLMFCDYSPSFRREFRKWLAAKYRDDDELREAWGDDTVSLEEVSIPRPREMVVSGQQPPLFPDPADNQYQTAKSALTKKGLDFYKFRIRMRAADRRYYAKLFKENDPDHVLIFNGSSAQTLADPLVDGLTGNPNLFWPAPPGIWDDMYFYTLELVRRASAQHKLAIISAENRSDLGLQGFQAGGRWESDGQIRYLETVGNAVKCAGGMFAYVADLLDAGDDNRWVPSWFSDQALAAAGAVAAYVPAKDCACPLVRALYEDNGCSRAPRRRGCGNVDKAYESLCLGRRPAQRIGRESCDFNGDGMVDAIERRHCQGLDRR